MTPRTLRLLPLAILLFSFAGALHAQAVDDDFAEDFPEEELPYVAFGAGFTPTFVFMNLDELNDLAHRFDVDEFSGPLSVYGGNVIFTPIFVRSFRVGFFAVGGYQRSSRPKRLGDTVYQRTLRFGIRFEGGLEIDYAIPLARRLTLLPSAVLGWGSYALEVTQSRAGGVDYLVGFDPRRFGTDTAASMRNLDRAVRLLNYHAFVYPAVHLEYAFTGNIMLRASAGYHFGVLDNTWYDEGDTQYSNVANIKANGPAAQLGIFIGLFQQ